MHCQMVQVIEEGDGVFPFIRLFLIDNDFGAECIVRLRADIIVP